MGKRVREANDGVGAPLTRRQQGRRARRSARLCYRSAKILAKILTVKLKTTPTSEKWFSIETGS